MFEHWVEILEFPRHMVSNFGRVMHRSSARILRPGAITNSGYFQTHFYGYDGRRYVRYTHRVVAGSFFDVDLKGYEVNHINGDKFDNAIWNLEVVTPSQNSQHAYDAGLRLPPSMKRVVILETGEEFDSISDCARRLERTLSTVSAAIHLGRRTAGYTVQFL